MIRSDVKNWLGIVKTISEECRWDRHFILTMETDDQTLVIQVRKSPLVFTIKQDSFHPPTYTVSYTALPPSAPPGATVRWLTPWETRPALFVDAELEQWLRQSVAAYAADRQPGELR